MTTTINADNGVVSGSAGLKEISDSSGILALQTNGVTAVTIDGAQDVTLANALTVSGVLTASGGVVGAVTGNASTATALTTASGSAPSYSARAWVNFNGTGTVAIRASGNVSSITDNGVGTYTVNFTTAMVDANYCVTYATHKFAIIGNNGESTGIVSTTTTCKIPFGNSSSGSAVDPNPVCLAFFR